MGIITWVLNEGMIFRKHVYMTCRKLICTGWLMSFTTELFQKYLFLFYNCIFSLHYNSTYAATEAGFLSSPAKCSETHPQPASSPTWPVPLLHRQWIIQLRDRDLKDATDPNDNVLLCPMTDQSIVLWTET